LVQLRGKRIGKHKNAALEKFTKAAFFIVSLSWNYSWEIAPTGHPSAQEPQSKHVAASISNLPSPSLIAPAGQVPSHAPQLIHSSEITYAILITLLEKINIST
jgi:hypothetical protein